MRILLVSAHGVDLTAGGTEQLGTEPTVAGIAEGSRRLLDAGLWERTLAARPQVGDHQDLDHWLDDHEAVNTQAGATT